MPYYGRRSHYSWGEDDWDEDDFEEYDVDTEEVYAHAFVSAAEDKKDVKKFRLDEDELLAETPFHEGPGRGYSISEATGNEGATKDVWYHRGAVIIWPRNREFDLVTKMDLDYGIHVLKTSLQAQTSAAGVDRQKVVQLADHILENLPSYLKDEISKEIIFLEDVALLKKLLHKQWNQYPLSQVDNQRFMQIVGRFGWQPFEEEISPYLIPRRGALGWLHSFLLAGVSFPVKVNQS